MLMAAAILAIFVYGLIAAFLGTILPDLSSRFQLTPKQNGTIAFAQALGLIIASLAVGPLIDTQGKKVSLVLGLAIVSVALLLLPRSRQFGHVVMLLFLLGLGGGTIVTGSNALVSDVGEAHRATALTFVNLFFGLGGLVTPFLSANVFRGNSVRLGYTIAMATLATLALHATTTMPGPNGEQGFVIADAGAVLGRPALLLLGLMLFLYVSCEVGMWNWLVKHLIAQGIEDGKALNILSFGFALGLLLGRMLLSPVLMRVPALNVTLVAAICMAITTALMLRTADAKTAGVLVFLAGASMAPVFPATVSIVGDAFPRMTATAIGLAITCGWIGLAVSSRIIGAIAGGEDARLRKALVVIPVFSTMIVVINVAVRFVL